MKQNITPEDLAALTESQKANLRGMWLPAVNTMAVASICKDVVNEEYDTIVFVIGEILVQEGSGSLVLRRLKLQEDAFIAEDDEVLEGEEEFEFEYSEPDQYFSKVDCLPLLNIGQLIELLSQVRYGQGGFDISVPPAKRLVGDKGFTLMNRNELEFEEDELCDALWKALVENL